MVARLGIPPWHMWGNSQTIHLIQEPGPASFTSDQLLRVNYGRPETWSFFFWSKVVDTSAPGAVGAVLANFDVTLGIGRSSITIPFFVSYSYLPPVIPTPGTSGALIWGISSTFYAGVQIEQIPAQDIQVTSHCSIQAAAIGTTVDVEVGAFFSPKSHVRPEWFESVGEFRGGENHGQ